MRVPASGRGRMDSFSDSDFSDCASAARSAERSKSVSSDSLASDHVYIIRLERVRDAEGGTVWNSAGEWKAFRL